MTVEAAEIAHGVRDLGRPRTAAATLARQRAAARRAAVRLGMEQVTHLDDQYLIAITEALIGEAMRRGIQDKLFEKRKVETDG